MSVESATIDECSVTNVDDCDCGKHFPDSIGVSGDWRNSSNPVWETPFGALIPRDVKALFAAGRCIGSTGDNAWEVFRVIPAAAMTGEAAGTAAALCVKSGISTHELNVETLQTALEDSNCMLFCPFFE